MQEARQFKPSTLSRRFSVVAGFYRTCVIDGLLGHSPVEHVRRPSVPAESFRRLPIAKWARVSWAIALDLMMSRLPGSDAVLSIGSMLSGEY